MMKKTVLAFIAFCNVIALPAQSNNAKEIMEKSNAIRRSSSEIVELNMTLINKKGIKNNRELVWYSKMDKTQNRSTFIRFLAPADIKGTSFLSIEKTDNNDDQWLYLPALKRVRRISSGEQTDSFMGSDFTFEDIGMDDDNLDDFSWSFLAEQTVDNNVCFVIQGIPSNNEFLKTTGYSKRVYFIRKDLLLPSKIELYNNKGEHNKTLKIEQYKEIDNGIYRGFYAVMENFKTGHKTELNFKSVKINQAIKDEIFTTRYLEKVQ